MGDLAVIVLVLAAVAAINVIALAASRGGATRSHQALFWCGLTGLLSLPIFVGSSLVLGMALIVATFNSPPGYLVILSGAFGLISTVASVFFLGKLRMRNSPGHV